MLYRSEITDLNHFHINVAIIKQNVAKNNFYKSKEDYQKYGKHMVALHKRMWWYKITKKEDEFTGMKKFVEVYTLVMKYSFLKKGAVKFIPYTIIFCFRLLHNFEIENNKLFH